LNAKTPGLKNTLRNGDWWLTKTQAWGNIRSSGTTTDLRSGQLRACLFSLLVDAHPVEAAFCRITIPTASSILAFQFKEAASNEAAATRSEKKSRCLARFSRLSAENRRKSEFKHSLRTGRENQIQR
jgi:hypothetical protein